MLYDVLVSRRGLYLHGLQGTPQSIEVLHGLVLLPYSALLAELGHGDGLAEGTGQDIILVGKLCWADSYE